MDKQNDLYIYILEYYSDTQLNEILLQITTWMNFENVMLSERSQTQQATFILPHLYETCSIGKSREIETRLEVAWD